MVSSDEFGPLVAGEAQRRGFYDAPRQAFLGDGLGWNWTLQKKYFPGFVAIVDFVHPLSYIYQAARVIAPDNSWSFYLQATTDLLAGPSWRRALHVCGCGKSLTPRRPVKCFIGGRPASDRERRGHRILSNNQHRMDYRGLPQGRASRLAPRWFESLIKEINYRVKGSRTKFWNRPAVRKRSSKFERRRLCD